MLKKDIEQVIGALIGVAVGDALGAPVERMSAEAIAATHGRVTQMLGGGWLKLKPGEITDDTEMTLCVAKAIMQEAQDNGKEAPMTKERLRDIGARLGMLFFDWLDGNPFCGVTCRDVIIYAYNNWFNTDTHPYDAYTDAAYKYHTRSGEKSGGNGSLMRTVYPGLFYDDMNTACSVAYMQSRLTHYDPEAALCCEVYTKMVYFALRHTIDATKRYIRLQRNVLVSKGFLPTEGKPDGYVKNSLRVLFDAILTTNTFTDAVLYAVNLGGDADTNGAIVGGLAGAMYGINSIPNDWYFALDEKVLEDLNEAAAHAVI